MSICIRATSERANKKSVRSINAGRGVQVWRFLCIVNPRPYLLLSSSFSSTFLRTWNSGREQRSLCSFHGIVGADQIPRYTLCFSSRLCSSSFVSLILYWSHFFFQINFHLIFLHTVVLLFNKVDSFSRFDHPVQFSSSYFPSSVRFSSALLLLRVNFLLPPSCSYSFSHSLLNIYDGIG